MDAEHAMELTAEADATIAETPDREDTVAVDLDLCNPGPIRQIRIDPTSRCNLRCVYCAVSAADYRGRDMDATIARKSIDTILELARHNDLEPVDMNGHGETTYREGWTEICYALIERGVAMRITTNFAKPFNAEELETLACMQCIAISIDTANPELLRKVRRHVDLRQIVTNMALVRAAAIGLHRPRPDFVFSCGLYDKSALDWEEFANFAVAMDIKVVVIWSLTTHERIAIPADQRVRTLDELSDDELRPRLASIRRGLAILARHRVQVVIQGDFVTALEKRVNVDVGSHA